MTMKIYMNMNMNYYYYYYYYYYYMKNTMNELYIVKYKNNDMRYNDLDILKIL